MGILDFIRSFTSKTEQEKVRKDLDAALLALDIDVAISAHENWKLRLGSYLEGNSQEDLQPEVICADNRCDLGKWIYSTGQDRLGNYSLFSELHSVHQLFHHQASNVVVLHQTGKIDEARSLLEGEYSTISNRIVRRLKDLKLLSQSGR